MGGDERLQLLHVSLRLPQRLLREVHWVAGHRNAHVEPLRILLHTHTQTDIHKHIKHHSIT